MINNYHWGTEKALQLLQGFFIFVNCSQISLVSKSNAVNNLANGGVHYF